MEIRRLDVSALEEVSQFYVKAPDYWILAQERLDAGHLAEQFFTDAPPGCDPNLSVRLGLLVDGALSGLAEVSFGFPSLGDAYLDLMIIGSWAQGRGYGRLLLAEIEMEVLSRGSSTLYLAVLDVNPRARAFWEREGFLATGVSRRDDDTNLVLHRLVKRL